MFSLNVDVVIGKQSEVLESDFLGLLKIPLGSVLYDPAAIVGDKIAQGVGTRKPVLARKEHIILGERSSNPIYARLAAISANDIGQPIAKDL